MQIGEAAKATGVSAKMIRHYEAIGLVPAAGRRQSNYRDYSGDDLHRLGFIRPPATSVFPWTQIRDLLWSDTGRSSADVKAVAQRHVENLNAKILMLQKMSRTLGAVVEACEGDQMVRCRLFSR